MKNLITLLGLVVYATAASSNNTELSAVDEKAYNILAGFYSAIMNSNFEDPVLKKGITERGAMITYPVEGLVKQYVADPSDFNTFNAINQIADAIIQVTELLKEDGTIKANVADAYLKIATHMEYITPRNMPFWLPSEWAVAVKAEQAGDYATFGAELAHIGFRCGSLKPQSSSNDS